MFKPLPLFIGLRYTAAKRKNNFISFISFVSIGGIALGVMTMIVVLSVMNGFQKEVAERSIAMAFHNRIFNVNGPLNEWKPMLKEVKEIPGIIGSAPYIDGQGLLSVEGTMAPIQIFGVNPQYENEVSPISHDISSINDKNENVRASFDLLKEHEFGILLSTELAFQLGVRIHDYVSLITSEVNVTMAGVMPRMKRLKVIGLFNYGMHEFDVGNAFVHITDAGKLFRVPEGSVNGIRLKLTEPLKAREKAIEVRNILGGGDIMVYTWINEFGALFKMIEIEKITMFIIMSLIVAVAVFNVVSMLVMVVTEKRSEIAILRTLGMSPKDIMLIFMVQGTFIGFFGASIGIILGLLIAYNVKEIVSWIEELLGKTIFEASVYPVSSIPSEIIMGDVLTVSSIAFILACIATLYPAWQASRTQPAEALRYE